MGQTLAGLIVACATVPATVAIADPAFFFETVDAGAYVLGATDTAILTINDQGGIIGSYSLGETIRTFYRDPDLNFTTFDRPVAGPPSNPYDVSGAVICLNNSGVIVGTFADGSGAFIRDASGNLTSFQVQGLPTRLTSICDAGYMAGTYQDAPNHWTAFLRHPDGRIVTFPTDNDFQCANYACVNNPGSIAVSITSPAGNSVWTFDSSGNRLARSFLSSYSTGLVGIQDDGTLSIHLPTALGGGYGSGFILRPDGTRDRIACPAPVDIDPRYQSHWGSTLVGVSASGLAAGTCGGPLPPPDFWADRGYIRDPYGQYFSFDVLGHPTFVTGLNSSDQVVGYDTVDGHSYGFIATILDIVPPPTVPVSEPPTLIAAVFGAIMVGWTRWQRSRIPATTAYPPSAPAPGPSAAAPWEAN